jgi:hypothetical protein
MLDAGCWWLVAGGLLLLVAGGWMLTPICQLLFSLSKIYSLSSIVFLSHLFY